MSRFTKNLFSIASLVAAGVMLFVAVSLIKKNSPKEQSSEVRHMPPTAPNSSASLVSLNTADKDAVASKNSSNKSTSPTVTNYIGGVGLVEPVNEAISIGSQLPGIVEQLLVKPGDQVSTGDVLLQLDRRSAAADLAVARAELLAQESRLQELLAQIPIQQARFAAAKALLDQNAATESNAKREYERAISIRNSNALSEEEIDARKLNWETAKGRSLEAMARVAEAQSNLNLLAGEPVAASIEVQKAAIELARANREKAQNHYDLLSIVAQKDGVILSVKIRVGEFVPAAVLSSPFITLGVIDPLHLRVDIDESEIPRFHPGARAFASLRGQPEIKVPIEYVRTEPLVIPKRSLTGTVSERVDTRVLQVIYSADPKTLNASVGQQVDVYIEETKHN
ncbi:MAG: HlyD family secretion protein [Pirellula sp.]